MSDLPILPTTVVGSHGKPGWWHACKDLHDEGAWGPYDLAELLDDATDVAILDRNAPGWTSSATANRAAWTATWTAITRHRWHPRPADGAPCRSLGVRPADALRSHG